MNRKERRAAGHKGPAAAASPAADMAFAQGVQLQKLGRMGEAEQAFRAAIAHNPRHADALHLLGLMFLQAGHGQQAADLIGKAAAIDPRSPQFRNNLGSALRAAGRKAEAEACFRQALSLRPDYPRALINLGRLLTEAGKSSEAIACLRRAIALAPNDLEALAGLAFLVQGQGALAEAADLYRRAAEIAPGNADIHENIAGLLIAQGRASEGADAFRRAVELKPTGERWSRLAGILETEVRFTEAAEVYRRAIACEPDLALPHNGLGNVLAAVGDLDGAIPAYRESIRLSPDYFEARSNLIMTMHSHPDVSAADLLAETRAYAARVEPRAKPVFANPRDPERRLRVGYVSADFREHPVGVFLDRVLPAHDPARIEAVLYSDTRFPDDQTARLRAHAGWREIIHLPHADAARMIAGDGVDILIDLAGHTGYNRLPMFAARAAPVQAAWLGYFGTTGLSAIDHILADAIVLPPGEEPLFTEAPQQLDAPYLCWSPPQLAMPVGPLPALANGYVTFGCFNNRSKISTAAIAAWARILTAVEGSRLFLKWLSLGDAGCVRAVVQAFAAHGIGADRLILEGFSDRAGGLAAYNRVDIALDPFPFGGCTTTADTLWMGVPVVTRAGDRWSGRMSQTILTSVGLEDWVAPDVEAYVATAVRLAGDLAALAPVRAGLRRRLEASPFCDGQAFALRLDAAYRSMWRQWCAGRG